MECDILEYATKMECKELHMTVDSKTSLKAIVAIHNIQLGPALGGCRFIVYPSTTYAVEDAIRLAKAMTYKAAISNLPLGGGKMVLLKPEGFINKIDYFKTVGKFVNSLQGRYITAVDSGTGTEDMDIIATETAHVTSTTSCGDPSILAAEGVERGILAAVQFKLGKSSLKGLHIALQGLGHAGYSLGEKLHQAGAKLTVYDINPEVVNRFVSKFGAKKAANMEELFSLECDVLSPCALGGILNDHTIPLIKAPIVAGSANNQLLNAHHGADLMKRQILYAPDYVINAGGLIYVAAKYGYIEATLASKRINDIYDTLLGIFKRSALEFQPTSDVADIIAREKLGL